MSEVFRSNRKASDGDLIRLNSLGLSLSTIAQRFGLHPTTVSQRLIGLGIRPADTRRSFMEDICNMLSDEQQDWLADELGPATSIKGFVHDLIVSEYLKSRGVHANVAA